MDGNALDGRPVSAIGSNKCQQGPRLHSLRGHWYLKGLQQTCPWGMHVLTSHPIRRNHSYAGQHWAAALRVLAFLSQSEEGRDALG